MNAFTKENCEELKRICKQIESLMDENVDGELMLSQKMMLGEGIKQFIKTLLLNFLDYWMKSDWGNTYLLVILTIPILIFGIFVNWWLAIIIEYVLTGLLIWIEGWNEKDTVDIGKKKYHKNYIIIYWGYFLLYRLYEVWKDNKLSKTDEEIINEKRYKTLKKIL